MCVFIGAGDMSVLHMLLCSIHVVSILSALTCIEKRSMWHPVLSVSLCAFHVYTVDEAKLVFTPDSM